jgi:pilus assembly protein CpaE
MLFAPKKPEAAEYIGKDSIEKMLKIFQNQYDLIIIDTGINFNECTLYVLDHTETILYVTTGEIVALKNTKLGLGVMKSLGYNNDKVKIVINRFASGYGIGKAEVEEVFKDNIFAIIPEDKKAVSVSVNKGQPLNDNSRYRRMKIVNAIELMGINLLEKKAT